MDLEKKREKMYIQSPNILGTIYVAPSNKGKQLY